jgi:hypothetical protein
MTNWREFAEELIRELDDARNALADLEAYPFAFAADYKSAKLVKRATEADIVAIEAWEAEQIIDDLTDTWRRKLWVAQILSDRPALADH